MSTTTPIDHRIGFAARYPIRRSASPNTIILRLPSRRWLRRWVRGAFASCVSRNLSLGVKANDASYIHVRFSFISPGHWSGTAEARSGLVVDSTLRIGQAPVTDSPRQCIQSELRSYSRIERELGNMQCATNLVLVAERAFEVRTRYGSIRIVGTRFP